MRPVCVARRFEGFLNVKKLNMWIGTIIQEMGANLFRYKGVLSVAGMKKKFVFQGVGMLFSGGFVDTEWAEGEKRECRFVFIGRDLDKQKLIDGFTGEHMRRPRTQTPSSLLLSLSLSARPARR